MLTMVYIEVSSTSPRRTEKQYGYVLEAVLNGNPVTKAGFGSVEGTYHQATLQAMIAALKRFSKPAEVHVVCANGFVLGQIKNIKAWLKNDFRTTKGKPVANEEEWRQLAALMAQHKVVPDKQDRSSYTGWLQTELSGKGEKNV